MSDHPTQLVALTLERLQVAELRGLMREAFLSGGTVFGELRRDGDDVILICGLQTTARSKMIQQLLRAGEGCKMRLTTPSSKVPSG